MGTLAALVMRLVGALHGSSSGSCGTPIDTRPTRGCQGAQPVTPKAMREGFGSGPGVYHDPVSDRHQTDGHRNRETASPRPIDLRACSGAANPEFIGLGRVQHSQAPAASGRSGSACQHLPINPRFPRCTTRHPQVDSLPPPPDHRSATREQNEIDDFGNRVRFGLASSFLPLLVRAPRDDLRTTDVGLGRFAKSNRDCLRRRTGRGWRRGPMHIAQRCG
jgi:hypothetical protein